MSTTAIIDPAKVKEFWHRRSAKLGQVPFEAIVNLEEKPDLQELKTRQETECILPLLGLKDGDTVLDLGAGIGQWSFRFADRVKRVVAVEYTASLVEIGREEARRRGIDNVEFFVSSAEDYVTDEQFDVVFISGLFMYLTDAQVAGLLPRLAAWVKPGGRVVLRETTSLLPHRYEIVDRWSEALQTRYSAIYRTKAEFQAALAAVGLDLRQDGQLFPEGSPLNKFHETRLRYYLFRPNDR